MRVYFFILLCVVGTALGVAADNLIQGRIIQGESTTIEDYPFMVNMEKHILSIYWHHECGGALITVRSVLSASHCYEGNAASKWRARLGATTQRNGAIHKLEAIIMHDDYSDPTRLNNDVAIVRLKEEAVLSATVALARLPSAERGLSLNLPDNTSVIALGWGETEEHPSSINLQEAEIHTINHGVCAERYDELVTQPCCENYPIVTSNMICAGILDVGGKDACRGDSGGPLIYENDIVVGITSWSHINCGHARYPGIYTLVSNYVDWIEDNI